jgi:1-deoxy-D-xylulose-5-phosphate reductoisomerase
MASGAKAIDFSTVSAMTFESFEDPMHKRRYPGLQLAWQVLKAPRGSTAVLNAANEVAVNAFLEKRIRFDQIHALNVETLSAYVPQAPSGLEDLLEIDAFARKVAQELIPKLH